MLTMDFYVSDENAIVFRKVVDGKSILVDGFKYRSEEDASHDFDKIKESVLWTLSRDVVLIDMHHRGKVIDTISVKESTARWLLTKVFKSI